MKSKTKIEKQIQKKTNNLLVETIIAAKKKDKWIEVASELSGSRRQRMKINLKELDKQVKDKENVVIVGKILSDGEVTKKFKVVAEGFSETAKDKLLKAGCEISTILEEIKKNPEAKGVRIIK